jgi:peptidoglycan-N-acetylglucosamine deacetylase
MSASRFAIAMFALLATPCAAANHVVPGGDQIALFQNRTIFHAGLRGAHAVALTFDDGPNANTGAVLDALKASNVKATFFIVGKMAKLHPEMLVRIAREGHLLANHSATHPVLTPSFDDDPQQLIAQLREVHQQIAPLMQPADKFYFRAPFGYWRSAHAGILNSDPVLREYVGPIYWDIGGQVSMRDGYILSSSDWECWKFKWTPQVCAKGYLREIRRDNGGVVLMHSIHKQSGELTAAIVPAMLEEGYSFVRLDQVPEYRQYETPKPTPAAVADASRRHSLAPMLAKDIK